MASKAKSTTSEIRARFDSDVERFSNLDTGQQSTIDAPLSLELITEAARVVNPQARHLLDIGCGAGNYSLKMLQKLPDLDCTLVDLSLPMLERAKVRVGEVSKGTVRILQADIRKLALEEEGYDIILAGAVLHHLRAEDEWQQVYTKLYRSLKKGGSLWISDLVVQDTPAINQLIWQRYGDYLQAVGGREYQNKVLAYIEQEDSPRSLTFQLDLLRQAGFRQVEVLHKHLCFAAFGAIKE